MEEQLINFETAKLAKEKGLKSELNNQGYIYGYNLKNKNPYPSAYKVFMSFPSEDEWLYAPTQSLLQKWLREEHNIHIEIKVTDYVDEPSYYFYIFGKYEEYMFIKCLYNSEKEDYKTYEEALEDSLIKGLELI